MHRSRRIIGLLVLAACVLEPITASSDPLAPTALGGLGWRLIGPFRSGWSTMAAGVADQPDTYYSAYAGGGVWKTVDSGQTWVPIFDSQPVSAVGALAVAPSDPKIIYVGTGQIEERYDMGTGNGVYRSSDGGQSWRAMGLEDTRHIGAVYVDPRNADIVLVAAIGHLYGSNEARGVFRSADGGQSWTRVLSAGNHTGAVDIAGDPGAPDHIYASTWNDRQWPWLSYFMPSRGPSSAIYESRDNGQTWARVPGKGLPQGDIGRIGLAVGHTAAGARIYASVTAQQGGGLYRSDDGGGNWTRVSEARSVVSSYFSRMTLDPRDANTVYLTGQSIKKSTDGGRTFTVVRGAPGGDDYHYLWINPSHPERMIAASDQGSVISVTGGATWSSWYNAPTGQFYYLAADSGFPYRIYSGQQDSGTVEIASRSDYGAISFRDWAPVGGDERDFDLPDPEDANIVYATGLGGRVSRWDRRTGEVQNVTPWPVNSYGQRPADHKYHYSWFTPIAFGARAPFPLYFGSQKLLRSLDHGEHWQEISPQLSHHDPKFKDCDGYLQPTAALGCGVGVIYSIAPAPQSNDEIWIGTDDGIVQLTRDGGRSWHEITPPGVTPWSKISRIDVSALAAGTAYVAVDRHRQDEYAPHVWRTRDYGATWTDISAGLPAHGFVNVVRSDPQRAGLLYAGTDQGVQYSIDDGAHWQSLSLNLPPAWVNDLLVHGDDLIAATQGRALWILDDVSRLRQLPPDLDTGASRLFAPATAIRWRSNQNKDTPPPAETPLGANPPEGAIIDYFVGSGTHAEVALEVLDRHNQVVRRFSSREPDEPLAVERYFAQDWIKPAGRLSPEPGAHRFVWDLRYPRPKASTYKYSISASRSAGVPVEPRGPMVPPGSYRLRLSVDGTHQEAPLEVVMDPRRQLEAATVQAAVDFSLKYDAVLGDLWRHSREIDALRSALDTQLREVRNDNALHAALQSVKDRTQPWVSGDSESSLNTANINETLGDILADVGGTDRAPTAAQSEVAAECARRAAAVASQWQSLRERELAALNAQLRRAGRKQIVIPGPTELGTGLPEQSTEMP